MQLVEVVPYGIVFAVLDQAIVRIVGGVWGGCAGVVFERVVGGHLASLCVNCGLSAIWSAVQRFKELLSDALATEFIERLGL